MTKISDKNAYSGKMFSIMGDSISTLRGYNPEGYAVHYEGYVSVASGVTSYGSTWWGQLIDALEGTLLVNNSFSGSLVSRMPYSETESYGCSDERCGGLGKDSLSPDVIMIYIGTNDWGYGVKPEAENEAEKKDLSIFRTAYELMLHKIKENYPDAEIWCFTLSTTKYSLYPDFSFPAIQNGKHISEFCRIIKECAKNENCRIIDLYSHPHKYDTLDGLHPNAEGMKTLSANVMEIIGKQGLL